MAGFRPRGSIIQFNWQETAEGREFLGGILHRNRRKTFGLLEAPSLPPQLSIETVSYKIFLTGKPAVGKTSTVAKLLGQEIPSFHVETPGIQTSVVYWPAKLKENQKVVMFKFQLWDCGEHAIRKYDHLLPALKEKADAGLFLFSFTDRGSFDDLPNQMNRVLDQQDKILQIAVATRLDQILNSDFTEQEIREFEEQWQVPVLRIANVTGKRLADGRSLDGRSGVMNECSSNPCSALGKCVVDARDSAAANVYKVIMENTVNGRSTMNLCVFKCMGRMLDCSDCSEENNSGTVCTDVYA